MSLSEAFPGRLAASVDLPSHGAAIARPLSAAPLVNTFQHTAAKTDVASAHLWGNGSHRCVLPSHGLGMDRLPLCPLQQWLQLEQL